MTDARFYVIHGIAQTNSIMLYQHDVDFSMTRDDDDADY
jgi:hypothetical protein